MVTLSVAAYFRDIYYWQVGYYWALAGTTRDKAVIRQIRQDGRLIQQSPDIRERTTFTFRTGHTVTVTDVRGTGLSAVADVTIKEGIPPVPLKVSNINVNVVGQNVTGSVTIIGTGIGTLHLSWGTGITQQLNIPNLGAGTHPINITLIPGSYSICAEMV